MGEVAVVPPGSRKLKNIDYKASKEKFMARSTSHMWDG